jgi:hypothetical protein
VWFAKRNGEIAMIAAHLVDAGDTRGMPLLERAWERFECGAWVAREAARMPALATIYPPFWRHGLRDAALEDALARTAAAASDPALRLLVASAFVCCERTPPWSVTEIFAASELARRPATWSVDTRYAYLAMHVACSLAPRSLLPDEFMRYVQRSLPAWIGRFVCAGELDLVGESIMAAHALGNCVPACEWQVLLDAQEPDGLVPIKAEWRGRDVPARVRFEGNYHSTLVALGAAAMCGHTQ